MKAKLVLVATLPSRHSHWSHRWLYFCHDWWVDVLSRQAWTLHLQMQATQQGCSTQPLLLLPNALHCTELLLLLLLLPTLNFKHQAAARVLLMPLLPRLLGCYRGGLEGGCRCSGCPAQFPCGMPMAACMALDLGFAYPWGPPPSFRAASFPENECGGGHSSCSS